MTTCVSCGFANDDGAAVCAGCGDTPAAAEALAAAEGLLPAGTRVGRYVIVSALGKGGMGSVYKARDEVLDEVIALKVLPAAADREAARRLLSEIRLARKVTHRNVCRIYEYGEDGGRQYISMELVEGDHLRELLRTSGPPPIEAAVDISIQMAKGLGAIHEAGIIHRDIKASNVMRNREADIKIMDLGVAKLEASVDQSTTAAGMVIGTPFYMSPEQASGAKLDFRSDIYALGVVMFELVTGKLPFRGETPIATLYKHLHEPPSLAEVPEEVRAIIARALAKSPEDRFATAQEMVKALLRKVPRFRAESDAPSSPAWPKVHPAAADVGSGPGSPSRAGGSRSSAESSSTEAEAAAGPSDVRPLAEISGLTRALGIASVARDQAFPSRSRLSEPAFGQIDVFICYRRGDSEDVSGRIHDRLVARFGGESVFKDVDSIPPGANYKRYLEAVVQRCLVQLVVIGRSWVDARDESGLRRLDDPGDWVRIEVEAALRRDVPIIPLLVHGASMPREQQLPPSLAELAYLQGASVRRDPDFHVDMDRLIAALARYIPHGKETE